MFDCIFSGNLEFLQPKLFRISDFDIRIYQGEYLDYSNKLETFIQLSTTINHQMYVSFNHHY